MEVKDRGAMGNFQKITSLSNLPSDKILIAYIKEAKKLNEDDIKLPARKKTTAKEVQVPAYFVKTLKSDSSAWKNFEKFSYSNKKDYVEWIEEAKTDATREKENKNGRRLDIRGKKQKLEIHEK